MGKLRHIALAVPDIGASAKFYEQAFGMKRVRESAQRDPAVGRRDQPRDPR